MTKKRSWDPKNPEAVTDKDIENMSNEEKGTWDLDRYWASHGAPRTEEDK